ncbi:TPA: hypothetical protein N2N62_002585 [Citrobacter freundii]|jgi:hypothetical protein|nr:hypothetical protein [Citrobacter freundii]DAY52918.1 MAG TPA: hypothetical protein [Caudoviricetes sp.]HCL5680957.1 hypothetical protein [Citrobacter freundii]HCL6562780.1 hypothetical protein [Citrobacter freundii]HED3636412.1 hypothetical protein [Citrobacter freundii]
MKDFKDSLLAGIAAAKKAEDNRNEIRSVFSSVDEQIKDISDNKASFGRTRLYRRNDNAVAQAFITMAQQMSMASKREEYTALCIFDSEGKNGIEIAEWSEDDSGYPCSIRYSGEKVFCSGKQELEYALSNLLMEVKTGEAILIQINNYDKKAKPQDADPA